MSISKLYINGFEYRLAEESDRTRELRQQYADEGYPIEDIFLRWNDRPAALVGDAVYVQVRQAYDGLVDWMKRAPTRIRRQ